MQISPDHFEAVSFLFALFASVMLGLVTKRTDRERLRYGAYCLAVSWWPCSASVGSCACSTASARGLDEQLLSMKTFYIETFGCQMNAHDSEKVVGTLLQQGYRRWTSRKQAELVLYNTCSIRDKAEQKVFHRLQQFKRKPARAKIFGVLGCVAQQEGEAIFERAPHVSLVAGSASYTQACREMLVQLEAGNRRVTGLSLDTDGDFRYAFHAPRQSASRLHHHH